MTDVAYGGLVAGDPVADEPRALEGCGCPICRSMRENGGTKLLPNDAERPPEPMPGDPNQANVPFKGVLLPLTRNADGSYSISGDRNVDATLIGSKWGVQELTFSFPTDGAQYGPNYDSGLNKYHIDLGPLQQAAARAGFAMISSYTNLKFTEIVEGEGGKQAEIRISQTGDNDVGSAQGLFPSDKLPQAGDSWFGRTSQPFYDLAVKGSWGYSTMLHEIGHTMGLKHGHQDYTNADLSFYFGTSPRFGTRALEPQVDGQAWSLMTYTPSPGTAGFSGDKANQPQTYMQFDIAALQYMYGANYTTNDTNTTYRWNEATGEMSINGAGQGAPIENKVLMTVWDGGGVDTYDLSNYDNGLVIDLRPGGFTTLGPDQRANHLAWQSGVALAPGSIANALLFNNDARSLIENAIGGDGADRITGNQADNALTGAGGDDRLEGGAGSDLLDGGAGSDTAVFGGATGVTVTLNDTGADAVVTQGPDTDTLRSIENIVGTSGSDSLTGNAGANILEGGAGGADTLSGGGGNDRLIGGGFTLVNTTPDKADITKPASTNNSSIATAVDTAGAYDLAPRDDVANSTTIPHATINATAAGGSLEYYKFEVGAGATLTFDIDTKSTETDLDSWLELVDGAGTVLANNDTGNSNDVGFTGNDDARLTFTFATAGTYYIRVGQWTTANPPAALPLTAGQTYSLHISNPSAPADPASFTVTSTATADMAGGDGSDFLQGTFGNDSFDGGAGSDTASFVTAFSNTSSGVTVSLAVSGAQDTGAAGTDTLIGIENLIGSQYDDVLTGNTAANVMEGGAGEDTLDGGTGTDTASYAGAASGVTVSLNEQGAAQDTVGAGSDSLSNFENLQGSAFDDTLSGNAAVNLLTGGAGNDVLNGNAAGTVTAGVIDVLNGGEGDDIASFSTYTASVLAQLDGTNTVTVAVGGVNQASLTSVEGITGGQAADRLFGDARANVLSGLSGNDDLTGGDGDDTLDGGAGDDIVTGGAGSDTAVFSGSTSVTVDLRLTGAQNTGQGLDILSGIENLTGGSGDDVLVGNEDGNVFTDTGGNDSYIGNGGSDTVSYARAAGGISVTLTSLAAQTTGGGGLDTLAGIENVVGTAFGDSIVGSSEVNTLTGGTGSDFLVGQAGADVLLGGNDADALIGDANGGLSSADGADVIDGGQGRDVIIGGGGNDNLSGGEGSDVIVTGYGTVNAGFALTQVFVNDGGDDTVDGGEGNDLVYAYYTGRTGAVSFDLANLAGNSQITVGGVEAGSFTSVERVIFRGGVAGDTVKGGGTLDTLVGNDGNDVLDGWFGDDSLQGNAGDDTIIGGEGLDTLTFISNTTGVTVDLRITTAQNTGEGSDTISGMEYIFGGSGTDTFNGSDDFNLISDSLGGNDSVFGHGGDDMLNISRTAAAPANTLAMDGGAGDDIIQLNSGVVSPAPAPSSIGLAAGAGREVTALGAVGNRFLDTITVNAGDGADRVVLTAVKTATVNLGSGADVVSVSLLGAAGSSAHDLTLGSGADIIWLAGSGQTASTTARSNVVNDFQVGDFGDRFEMTAFLNGGTGTGATRTLLGYTNLSNPFSSGHMRLLQSGSDLLLQVDRDGSGSAHEFVTLFTLKNTASGGLTAFNFDGFTPILNLTGTAGNETLVGAEDGDNLNGDAGSDQLFGRGGDDLLVGGLGNDGLFGEAGADRQFGEAGNDVLHGGLGNDQLFGQEGADTLEGQDGDDFLVGGAGADYMVGGIGTDRLFGEADNDLLIGGEGNDELYGQEGADRQYGEAGNDTVHGAAGADELYGQDGDDSLEGQEGADFLVGGIGRDTMNGGADDDRLFGEAGSDLLIGGAGSDQVYGQEGDDTLYGEGGFDFLGGGVGNDRLFGQGGGDYLLGEGGADRFIYQSTTESNAAGTDRILDFSSADEDLIDLSLIDADVNAAGDQAFAFVSGFTGQAGQAVLIYAADSNTTVLFADVNGDSRADFVLHVAGNIGQNAGWVL